MSRTTSSPITCPRVRKRPKHRSSPLPHSHIYYACPQYLLSRACLKGAKFARAHDRPRSTKKNGRPLAHVGGRRRHYRYRRCCRQSQAPFLFFQRGRRQSSLKKARFSCERALRRCSATLTGWVRGFSMLSCMTAFSSKTFLIAHAVAIG